MKVYARLLWGEVLVGTAAHADEKTGRTVIMDGDQQVGDVATVDVEVFDSREALEEKYPRTIIDIAAEGGAAAEP